jgi:hypothetical protein
MSGNDIFTPEKVGKFFAKEKLSQRGHEHKHKPSGSSRVLVV